MESIIKDISLAPSGHDKINWVKNFMPVMASIEKEFSATKPFAGQRLSITIHLEAKTAYMAEVFKNAGAEVVVTGSNPLSTQDDVAAALVERGVTVFAKHACTDEEYNEYLNKAVDFEPTLVIDDGGDIISLIHTKRRDAIPKILGASEETTTGVNRLRGLENRGELVFPVIAANDAYCKYLFDNRYGTGQSTWEGIMRATNLVVAGKNVVIAGYGWCGKGAAMRAKGLGANVIVTEVDPIKAIEAVFDGFRVMPMKDAAKVGDIFLTVTGNKDVITAEHYPLMKSGAILANAGHFDVEVNIPQLENLSVSRKTVRANVEEFLQKDGRKIYLLAQGRLVNLASGDGHPAEIMDLSFAVQFFSIAYILHNHAKLEKKVHLIPAEVSKEIAEIKLAAIDVDIDELTDEQKEYLNS